MWVRVAECEELIRSLWNCEVDKDAASRMLQRHYSVWQVLLGWDKLTFGHVRTKVKKPEDQLAKLYVDPISAEITLKRSRLCNELEEFLSREELMWKQRAKGIVEVLRVLPTKVTDDMNEALTQPFAPEEVKHALFQIYPYKSPGPDGMSPTFYQKYWHIIGPKVTSFVLDFLNHERFDVSFNNTFIVLIPKCSSPEFMHHFCPISLCNITYKISSKVLANRLKPFLPFIISDSQSAFLPEILSHLLVQEESRGELRGVAISRQGPCVSHLLFVDNTLIFCQASDGVMHCVRQVLKAFEATSGMVVNLDKSKIAFSRNVPESWPGSSYTWHSILTAKELIVARTRWQVGSGHNIHLWRDRWIPRPLTFQIITTPNTLHIEATIVDLLDEAGEWKERLIRTIFQSEDVEAFLGSETGSISYKLACWNFIWKAKVQPKVRMFTWRACWDSLPMVANLAKQGIKVGGTCPQCGWENEDVLQCLLRCHFARLMWAISDIPWPYISCNQSDPEAWFRASSASAIMEQVRSWERALVQQHVNSRPLISSSLAVRGHHIHPTGIG
ncbi:UNVERIFIED_CONTAM: LINE-1 retrotransposable element O protein [Sesamum radiatum]|uniref:LINE-1 retrotransposable element O protein n=1 Tax=Sesamum radiatum TaxID=300843 RepID=A0AAW2QGX9_SESRA